MDFPKKKIQWAVGDRFIFKSGLYSGEEAIIKEFDIVGLENLGWRCYAELTTGSHRGQTVCAYTEQIERIQSEANIERKRTILVVEDDPDTQFLICSLLRSGGFDAVPAADGEEALRFLESCRPDVILTDLMMPHISGLELLHLVKDEPLYADIPVVVITAYGEHISDLATRAGALKVLNKPGAIEHIADTMNEVIH